MLGLSVGQLAFYTPIKLTDTFSQSTINVVCSQSVALHKRVTPFGIVYGVLAGVLISVTGYFGSLTVSVLKRDLLIGDKEKFETLQGKYLSRIDSLTYTAPVFFHVTRYFFNFM
ncbi:phosphatidate cytidylyltransferase [Pontibacillus sp. ALD_SL1]|nr:phosphatidate cytidylyltransferase [Pontibacillus sp. ALD_SL1]